MFAHLMFRRYLLAAIAVLFALERPATAQFEPLGPNLLSNPSFEDHTGPGLPDGWRGDRQVYSIDPQVARTGKASLKYVNHDANRYRLATVDVPIRPGWKCRFRAWIKTEAIAGEESGATLCLEWSDQNGKWLGGSYPSGVRGTSDWTRVEGITRVPNEATNVRLSCYVRRGMTGTAWFDDLEVVRVADPALQVILLSPGYRGRITSAGPREARFRVRLNLLDYDLEPQDVRLASRLIGEADQKVYWETTLTPDRPTFDKRVPVENLPVGRYTLAVSLLKPDGTPGPTCRRELVRVPDDFRPKCTIDEHRRLLVDGKPFFPLGMYWSSIREDELAVYAQSKFNCLMPYGSPTREQMDLAEKYGLKVIYSIKDWYAGTKYCPKAIRTAADEEPLVRARVREFRDHPALLAWYLNDELPQSFLPQLEAHQRWVCEEDPDHPTWVVLYQVREVAAYLNTFDVIGTDPYPIGRKPASMAAEWTAETLRQVEGTRPLWQVPQAFNWSLYSNSERDQNSGRTPTFDEKRSMAWQCIAEGATGIVFWCWHALKRNPDSPFEVQWNDLKRIAAEIDQMAPVLLSVDPAPAIEALSATGPPERPAWLHTLVKSHDGQLYLIAVNDGDGEGLVRFTLPAAPQQISELSEGRTLAFEGASFQDQLPKLSVKIYRIVSRKTEP